jgi:hypothetical protein
VRSTRYAQPIPAELVFLLFAVLQYTSLYLIFFADFSILKFIRFRLLYYTSGLWRYKISVWIDCTFTVSLNFYAWGIAYLSQIINLAT